MLILRDNSRFTNLSMTPPGKRTFCSNFLQGHKVTLQQNETARCSLNKETAT